MEFIVFLPKIIPIPKFSSQVSRNKFYPIPNSTQWLYLEGFESNSLSSNSHHILQRKRELNRHKEQNPYLTKTRPDINTWNPNRTKARFPDCSTKPQAVPVRTIMSALDPSSPTLAGPENGSTADKQDKDLKAAYGCSKIENEDTP